MNYRAEYSIDNFIKSMEYSGSNDMKYYIIISFIVYFDKYIYELTIDRPMFICMPPLPSISVVFYNTMFLQNGE